MIFFMWQLSLYQFVNFARMEQTTERKSRELKERSQSVRNLKPKETRNQQENVKPECVPLASKPSKEYNRLDYEHSQKSASKNLNDHSDYIKNLYKKYLGKENNIQSEKKSKVEPRPSKSIIGKDDLKEVTKTATKLFQDSTTVLIKNTNTLEGIKKQYSELHLTDQGLNRNKSSLSMEMKRSKNKVREQGEGVTAGYRQMLNGEVLSMIGDPRSSLVRCMKGICLAKKMAKLR